MTKQQLMIPVCDDDSGRPLPDRVRARMEALFGADFSDVRIHEKPWVITRGIIACTIGPHIHFAPGVYDPWSQVGKAVLGHELAHVVQQRSGRVQGTVQGGMLINTDLALEAEAEAAGRQVARGEPVPIRGTNHARPPSARHQPVMQCYTVVSAANQAAHRIVISNRRYRAAPALRAGLRYVLYDTFVVQKKGGRQASQKSFLQTGTTNANLEATNPADVTLRLSTNGNIAIQHVNLGEFQSKLFYATQAVVDESNQRLELLGSHFRLLSARRTLASTIMVGANTLYRIIPHNLSNRTWGITMTTDESCNQLVDHVMGASPQRQNKMRADIDYEDARMLILPNHLPAVDNSNPANLARSMRAITTAYAAAILVPAPPAALVNLLQQGEFNRYANPEVGEGFMITSLVAPAVGGSVGGADPHTHEDHFHLTPAGNPKVVHKSYIWNSHWAGVVARDGHDVVTLENYARNYENDRLGERSEQYYFQMYNTDHNAIGQTWFDAWGSIPLNPITPEELSKVTPPPPPPINPAPTHKPPLGTKGFANPLAVKVVVPDSHYDAVATRLYGSQNLDNIKNDYNLIARAASAQEEILQVLKGLYYANFHLNSNSAGDKNRVQQWANALSAAQGTANFRQNLQAISYTVGQIIKLTRLN